MPNFISQHPLTFHSQRLADRRQFFPSHLRADNFYFRGQIEHAQFAKRAVAIVGTRKPTAYGLRFVRNFLEQIKNYDVTVLSGGAFGIDFEAHRMALELGLRTQAWVVGPIHDPSPKTHRLLYQKLAQKPGCGILVPDCLEFGRTNPSKSAWIQRNQWLAAASDALVVVEAAVASGTWSTAKAAGDYSIPVFVLPGCIDSVQSMGTNAMIAKAYGTPIASVGNLVKSLVVDFGWSSYNNKSRELDAIECPQSGPREGRCNSRALLNKPMNYLGEILKRPTGLELSELYSLAAGSGHETSELLPELLRLVREGKLRRSGDRFERRGNLYEPESDGCSWPDQ